MHSIARVTLSGRDVTRLGYFVLDPRTGDLTVGTAFPANPSSSASQDSSRVGHQSRGDSSVYLHDEYLLDIRVNDSAVGVVAGGPGGVFTRETAKSSSRKFFVRVEYGAGPISVVPEGDSQASSGGLLGALSRLLASHGLQVLLRCSFSTWIYSTVQ